MKASEIHVGLKFTDPKLLSQPVEYRIHRVTEITPTGFKACHLASGGQRNFGFEAVDELQQVPDRPFVTSNLDALVGEKVRVRLLDGGTYHMTVTAIRYGHNTISGVACSYVKEIEFDRSTSSALMMGDIESIELINLEN